MKSKARISRSIVDPFLGGSFAAVLMLGSAMASALNTASGAELAAMARPAAERRFERNRSAQRVAQGRPKADLADQGYWRWLLDARCGRDENLPAEQQGTGQRIRPGALGAGWQAGLDNADRQGRNPDQNPSYPAARSTPTIDGELLYALGSDGDLAALETTTGKIRWQKNIRNEFGGQPGEWAYSESPLVDGDVVVVTPGGEKATLCIEQETGALIWKSAAPGGDPAGYASAIVVQGAGRKQYVQFLSKGVVGVDARTGKFLWRYAEASKGPAQMATPVARGEYVYAAANRIGGGLVRLKATPDGVVAEQVYFPRGLPSNLGGSVLVGDHLYGTTTEGLVAAEFLSGRVKWQEKSIGTSSITSADGLLYLHGENGDVALVEASPEGYREKGRFTPPEQPKHRNAGEKSWAYPVVARGRL